MSFLTWLHTQADAATQVIGAVISNQPAPAREVVIYVFVIIALAVIIPKIVKLVSK